VAYLEAHEGVCRLDGIGPGSGLGVGHTSCEESGGQPGQLLGHGVDL
jgi:hypothetical protein